MFFWEKCYKVTYGRISIPYKTLLFYITNEKNKNKRKDWENIVEFFKDKWNHINWLKVIKIAVGSSLAIIIAQLCNIQFASSAGIITLLSIQDTRKETFMLAFKRIISFLATLIICYIVFYGIHFHTWAFVLVLLGIGALGEVFDWQGALSVNAVIATHFLQNQTFTVDFILNETALLVIGVGIGIIMNLYIPTNVHLIKADIEQIELDMKSLFVEMAAYIRHLETDGVDKKCLEKLENHVDIALGRAFANMNNTLYSHARYYIEYMEMRKNQCVTLQSIHYYLHSLTKVSEQAMIIADFMEYISRTIYQHNNTDELQRQLQEIRTLMREQPLPVTREEFENRALLYVVLEDFYEFIDIKAKFCSKLTEEQIRIYWDSEVNN